MGSTDVSIPGIPGSENIVSQSLLMVSEDMPSTGLTGPKIYGNLIYEYSMSF